MRTERPPRGVTTGDDHYAGRTDAQLVAALAQGDQSALAELYDRHAAVLYRAALLRVGDRQLAEEILQDTFVALWKRADLFDERQGSMAAWLSTIARNRAIDRLRGQGRRPVALPFSALATDAERPSDEEPPLHRLRDRDPSADDPAATVDGAWLRAEVERALAGMPAVESEVIRLAYYEELSQSEIAIRLDWPLGTVKTRTRRALARLRDTLADVRRERDGG